MSIATIAFEWMCVTRHGYPTSVAGDPEFDKSRFKCLLQRHNIKWESRSARRHNKLRIVERKNKVIKDIMERLYIADPKMTAITLAKCSGFLSNFSQVHASQFTSKLLEVIHQVLADYVQKFWWKIGSSARRALCEEWTTAVTHIAQARDGS